MKSQTYEGLKRTVFIVTLKHNTVKIQTYEGLKRTVFIMTLKHNVKENGIYCDIKAQHGENSNA